MTDPDFSTNPKLTDHKRHRNRLLAPWSRMKSDERMFFSSWTHSRLPEIVWIHELIHHLGSARSLDVLVTIVEASFEAAKHASIEAAEGVFPCPHLATYWKLFATSDVKESVLQGLRSHSLAKEVSWCLGPFHALYPEYPLDFLVLDKEPSLSPSDLGAFKKRLRDLSDRFSVAAVRVHSHIFLSEVRSGHLLFQEGMPLPDFDLIFSDNPDTDSDEFNRSAGMVRASVNCIFAMFTDKCKLSVASYFWNRGLELEDCVPSWNAVIEE